MEAETGDHQAGREADEKTIIWFLMWLKKTAFS